MPPASRRSPSTRVYGGFVNPTSVTYFLIHGPFHGQEVTLPHSVADYSPIKDGNEERYVQNRVNLFGRRIPALVHTSINGNESLVNDALAHALLQHPNIYEVWQRTAVSFPIPSDLPPALDETRLETAVPDAPR